jgi:hypothetical protein
MLVNYLYDTWLFYCSIIRVCMAPVQGLGRKRRSCIKMPPCNFISSAEITPPMISTCGSDPHRALPAPNISLLLSQYLRFSMAIFNLRQSPRCNCIDDPHPFPLGRLSSGKLFNTTPLPKAEQQRRLESHRSGLYTRLTSRQFPSGSRLIPTRPEFLEVRPAWI